MKSKACVVRAVVMALLNNAQAERPENPRRGRYESCCERDAVEDSAPAPN